jgi:hypothetical protein
MTDDCNGVIVDESLAAQRQAATKRAWDIALGLVLSRGTDTAVQVKDVETRYNAKGRGSTTARRRVRRRSPRPARSRGMGAGAVGRATGYGRLYGPLVGHGPVYGPDRRRILRRIP